MKISPTWMIMYLRARPNGTRKCDYLGDQRVLTEKADIFDTSARNHHKLQDSFQYKFDISQHNK